MAFQQLGDFHVQNHLRARNFSLQASIITTSASDLVLDSGSPSNIFFEGSVSGQIVTLPDATDDCLNIGHQFCFFNNSDFRITIRDFTSVILGTVAPEAYCCFHLKDKSSPAGIWISGKIELSRTIVDLENIVGVSGSDGQSFLEDYLSQVGIPIINEIPGGAINCSNLVFTIANEAIAGTISPTLDGRVLTPGLDFIEAVDKLGFTILIDPNNSNRLNSPPTSSEDLLVSYSKRVIF